MKDPTKRVRKQKQTTDLENIFTNHVFDQGKIFGYTTTKRPIIK